MMANLFHDLVPIISNRLPDVIFTGSFGENFFAHLVFIPRIILVVQNLYDNI